MVSAVTDATTSWKTLCAGANRGRQKSAPTLPQPLPIGDEALRLRCPWALPSHRDRRSGEAAEPNMACDT